MSRTFPLRLATSVDSRRSRECRRSYEACRLVPMDGCGIAARSGGLIDVRRGRVPHLNSGTASTDGV